jgi:hypothetical protein
MGSSLEVITNKHKILMELFTAIGEKPKLYRPIY